MTENTSLALLPLITATLVMAALFYVRDGAISLFSVSFMLTALSVVLLFTYMILNVLVLLPLYAWVVFGGIGLVITVGGIVLFFR